MLKLLPTFEGLPDSDIPRNDFTVIEKDREGNVVMEVNVWRDESQTHKTVALCMYPDEARLFAKMLSHHAEESLELSPNSKYGT